MLAVALAATALPLAVVWLHRARMRIAASLVVGLTLCAAALALRGSAEHALLAVVLSITALVGPAGLWPLVQRGESRARGPAAGVAPLTATKSVGVHCALDTHETQRHSPESELEAEAFSPLLWRGQSVVVVARSVSPCCAAPAAGHRPT